MEQLEDYTGRLRAAAERLTAENRRLRRCHADLVVKVGGIMSVDLLRQPQRWKDMLMETRHMMAALVQVRETFMYMYGYLKKRKVGILCHHRPTVLNSTCHWNSSPFKTILAACVNHMHPSVSPSLPPRKGSMPAT